MKFSRIKIYQSIWILGCYFHQKFCIDISNHKIIPIEAHEPSNLRKNPFYGEEIYYMMLNDIYDYNYYLHDKKFCNNSIKKEYDLSAEDCEKLMDFFNNKNLSGGILPSDSIHFSIDVESDIRYAINSKYWGNLNNILKDITKLDVLNLENIISQSDYDFKKDGIYHKGTSQKLKLKTLCFYNRDGSWLNHRAQFAIDFDKNKIRGCIDKELSHDDICSILKLLTKYNVYQWNFNDQWKKANNHLRPMGFGGRVWELELIFENDKVLIIGGRNEYPDTYVLLGEEIIDVFNIDFLRLDYVRDKEIYKKYGYKHLKQK